MTIICVRDQCQYDRNGVCNNECLINPDYLKLAQIAFDTVLQTMVEGEKEHEPDNWKEQCITCHMRHAEDHIEHAILGYSDENHIAHALTRCAMIKYLEENKQRKELQNEV